VGRNVFVLQENLLVFGPILCSTSTGRGAVERVKISNPTKIDVKVKFSMKSSSSSSSSTASATVDPKAKGAAPAAVKTEEALMFAVHPVCKL
jgi:hypothetical protein